MADWCEARISPVAMMHAGRRFLPGLALVFVIAAAATFIAETYGGPTMLIALLLGMVFNFTLEGDRTAPGVDLAARRLLRLGVALLGLRIAAQDVMALGLGTIEFLAGAIVATIGVGVIAASLLGLGAALGTLIGGATAICGASAALAIASVLPRRAGAERETAYTVVVVTALSTVAMVLYPVLLIRLGFDDFGIGVILGATIHDVAQVVGAGYSVSLEAGEVATTVKLFRVAMLLPLVLLLSVFLRATGEGRRIVAPIPGFAIAFALLVLANTAGLVPDVIRAPLEEVSRWCLIMAVAAIGVKTSLQEITRVGSLPLIVTVAATLFLFVAAVAFAPIAQSPQPAQSQQMEEIP